ncbi:MAG: UDP-N-acetylenolpyruvoylglucosamine reductase [Firmicutes bacterium]|nr:UDP-N-acetylenolpyruvoylglucosamine reductase [Bacillota bacterium]
MQNNHEFIADLNKILPKSQVLLNEPMKKHTTFKIGGPADFLVLPATVDEVVNVFKIIKKYQMPFTVLGNGSNVLVLDKGIRGVVVKFDDTMSYMKQEGTKIIVGSGSLLKDVAKFASDLSLSGMEFAIGIPGSIGGAVFMNAGAYDGEISNFITAVTAVSLDGEVIRYLKDDLEFGYRHSIFQSNHYVICEVELSLVKGNKEEIEARMDELTMRRESKQPLEMPSAGSTFKRPQGYFAGTLIEQTGLKGFKVGGAQISKKHAGFVVNAGEATAEDVLNLIQEVQKMVFEKHGVKLHPEVRTIGE